MMSFSKIATAKDSQLLLDKAPFQIFDWVLKTYFIIQESFPLQLIDAANLNFPIIFLI